MFVDMSLIWRSFRTVFCRRRAAHDDEGVAAAVEQDDDLFAAVERGLGFLEEPAGEDLFLAGLLELDAHVDEFDGGQRAVGDALRASR
jgi:hypothetical protein